MTCLSHVYMKKDPQITQQLIDYCEVHDSINFLKVSNKPKMSKHLLYVGTVNGLSPCEEREILKEIIFKNLYLRKI